MKIEIKINIEEAGAILPVTKEFEITSTGNDITKYEGQIKELQQIISDHCDMISDRNAVIRLLKSEINKLNELLYSAPAHENEQHDTSGKPKTSAELGLTEKHAVTASTPIQLVHCKECGNPVPANKKAPFCSTRCYNKNYAKGHSSKKVNQMPPAPG